MQEIMDSIMCSTYKDEERFIQIINTEIEKNKLESYPRFKKDCVKKECEKRYKAGQSEEKEALAMREVDMNELKSTIQKRNISNLEGLTGKIEKKYKKEMKSKGKSVPDFEEPSDEVFAAIQAKLMKK